ncbi:PAS domain S-box protein [Marinoscillum sp. MHG1-6]|uniref:PAS domain S-box protein n=1 Tax=Marinoscillum sp. MHG1-6 TaxID=2959627 RepID=UPI0021585578|nr:PAS domain S-box protein [Marinoscillum sp. MHG1-6]
MRYPKKQYYIYAILAFVLANGLLILRHSFVRAKEESEEKLIINERNKIESIRLEMETSLQNMYSDLLYLSNQQNVKNLRYDRFEKKDLIEDFTALLTITNRYDQIRFIDSMGKELVRVNYNKGSPISVDEKDLQDKSDRYYFSRVINLDRNQLYLSPIDLNMEGDTLERPFNPVVRAATPIVDNDGNKSGILIINYLVSDLLHPNDYKDAVGDIMENNSIQFINAKGYWLAGTSEDQLFGFMVKGRSNSTFGSVYPEEWERMKQSKEGAFYSDNGLFIYERAPLIDQYFSKYTHLSNFQTVNSPEYLLVSHIDNSILSLVAREVWRDMIIQVLVFILIILVILSYFGVRFQGFKKIREELLESNRFLSLLINSNPDAVLYLNKDRRIQWVNDRASVVFGYNSEEFKGRSPEFLLAGDYSIGQNGVFSKEGEGAQNLEIDFKSKSGKLINSRTATVPISDGAGKLSGLLAFIEDYTDFKSAEDKIQIFERFFNMSGDYLCIINQDGCFDTLNPAFCKMLGLQFPEVVGRPFLDFLHEEDIERSGKEFEKLLEGKPTISFINRYKSGLQGDRWLEWSAALDRERGVVFGAARDITQDIAYEEKLKRSEGKLSAIFNNTFNFMGFLSTEGNVIDMNKTALEFLGLSLEDIIATKFWELPVFLESESIKNRIKESIIAAAQGVFIRYELGLIGKNKKSVTVDFSITPIYDEDGGVIYLLPEGRDITDKVRVEKKIKKLNANLEKRVKERTEEIQKISDELSDQKVFLDSVIDNVNAMIFIKDLEGRFLLANEYLYKVIGLDEKTQSIIGKTDYDLFPKKVADEFRKVDVKVTEREELITYEESVGQGKEKIDFVTSKFPLYDGEGVVYAMCGISTNISTQKEQQAKLKIQTKKLKTVVDELSVKQQALIKSQTQLEQANEELESFSYSVSHDLRAPLRALEGFSKLLNKQYQEVLDETGKTWLDFINKNALKMDELINDILDFSRVSRLGLNRRIVDVDHTVRELVEEEAKNYPDHHFNIQIEPLVEAYADPKILRQVWANLISNAFKYSSNKNEIDIHIWSRSEEDFTEYAIADKGVGFDMSYSKKLFGVFQRLHHDEFKGTGVGLAIVKKILDKHEGDITFKSEVDKGTTFTFRLPRKKS